MAVGALQGDLQVASLELGEELLEVDPVVGECGPGGGAQPTSD